MDNDVAPSAATLSSSPAADEKSAESQTVTEKSVDGHRHTASINEKDGIVSANLERVSGDAEKGVAGTAGKEEEAGIAEEEIEYPSGFKLAILTVGLCLVLFVVSGYSALLRL